MSTLDSTRLVLRLNKLFLVLFILLQACGYSFQGDRLVVPEGVSKIYLSITGDGTPRGKDAELALKDAIESRFDRTSVITLVENRIEADSVLEVKIINYSDGNTATTSTTDSGLQKEATITVASSLIKSYDNSLIWNGALSSSKSFGSTSGSVLQGSSDFAESGLTAGSIGSLNNNELLQSQESEVLETITTKLAKDLFLKIFASEF